MKHIDITWPLDAHTRAYAPEEMFKSTWLKRMPEDGCNLSRFSMSAHCGTHLDAPRHFLEDGLTVEHAPLDLLNGPALVADLAALESGIPAGVSRLLIKHAERGLADDFAAAVAESHVRLLGIDGLSVGRPGAEAVAHAALLSAGVWLLESLRLEGVQPGWYELLCLPLPLTGLEASPVRAVLKSL